MRDVWFSRRVHPEGLELSTNGLRDYCYDVLNPNIIGLADVELEVCPFSQIWVLLVLLTNEGKSLSNRFRLNSAI